MRLSSRHRLIIEEVERDGYVWLSHLPINAQMRFRNMTRGGYDGFTKIEGLTFLTKRVAESIVDGTKSEGKKRLTLPMQVRKLESQLIELEAELYRLKGVGKRHEELKFSANKGLDDPEITGLPQVETNLKNQSRKVFETS